MEKKSKIHLQSISRVKLYEMIVLNEKKYEIIFFLFHGRMNVPLKHVSRPLKGKQISSIR
jgi:hypothetical protein